MEEHQKPFKKSSPPIEILKFLEVTGKKNPVMTTVIDDSLEFRTKRNLNKKELYLNSNVKYAKMHFGLFFCAIHNNTDEIDRIYK